MTTRQPTSWGIKLGSGGRCVDFCERHQIVGVGWKTVDPSIVASGDRDRLWQHVHDTCDWYKGDRRAIGTATGQLYRFATECEVGDLVAYYDPPRKRVQIARVISGSLYRDFDLDDSTDIWHYRKVELANLSFPILDFHGGLKGRLLGPRLSFWSLRDSNRIAEQLFLGKRPEESMAPDAELSSAFEALRTLLVRRAEALNAEQWEWLVVDYLKGQGAYVDERRVGGSRPIIDAEARFDHGELGEEVWRVQVKRLQNRPVDWSMVDSDFRHAGDARFCFVSVFGFTPEARARAEEEGVVLLEAGDFARFLLSGKLRPKLREVLRLPLELLP